MRTIYFIFLFFTGLSAFSQEIVTGLQYNPVIVEKAREMRLQKSYPSVEDSTPVALPFFDDFSKEGIFPSDIRWIDRDVYVNDDFPLNPINFGAATFDAINDSGSIYSHAVPGPQTFIADHLTSRFIRLDSIFTPDVRALHPSDSIYLSFYYQPQGRGRAPSDSDSLVLEFLLKSAHDSISPTDTTHIPDLWDHIWSSPGMSLDTFYIYNNSYFKRVMIPITNGDLYFKKYFRFRFFNYVSLTSSGQPSWQSNCDEWNIDNVYLNYGRSKGDTVRKEIRFIERVPSMLKNYTSMPYPQYSNSPSNEMIDTLVVKMTNRDTISRRVNYSYFVSNPGGSIIKTYTVDSTMMTYYRYPFGFMLHPPVSLFFPIGSADSNIFLMQHIVRDLTPGSVFGDTITGYQKFYNYFAYDDGTPEAGYGLKGTGAMMAYKFIMNKSPDTLRAVRIYFNHTLGHNNQQFFYLTVWNDNNGKPGDTVYSRLAYVTYTDSLNKFYTYNLENPVRLSGTFYVGTIQTTDDNLNIGLDLYRNSEEFMYYNTAGTWLQSTQGATLLMRPVVGKPIPVGIEPVPEKKGSLSIYPNPNKTGFVHIILPGKQESGNEMMNWKISIYDITGRKVAGLNYSETIDISGIPGGVYILTLDHITNHQCFTGKLVILH
jgi:hypothetical protein